MFIEEYKGYRISELFNNHEAGSDFFSARKDFADGSWDTISRNSLQEVRECIDKRIPYDIVIDHCRSIFSCDDASLPQDFRADVGQLNEMCKAGEFVEMFNFMVRWTEDERIPIALRHWIESLTKHIQREFLPSSLSNGLREQESWGAP